jgi:hypothetical protein
MAAKSDVQHVVNPDGSHSIGVTVDKVFIPFQTIDEVHILDRVAAGKSPEAGAAPEADEEENGK